IVDDDFPPGPTIAAVPAALAPGSTLLATWAGISSPASRDWISLASVGAPNNSFLAWMYVSCSQTAGNAAASGSCPFPTNAGWAAGTYEIRLFSNNGYTRLATNTVVLAPVVIGSGSLVGTLGSAYSQTLSATGGTGSYTWSRTGGVLPPGINEISPAGVISG